MPFFPLHKRDDIVVRQDERCLMVDRVSLLWCYRLGHVGQELCPRSLDKPAPVATLFSFVICSLQEFLPRGKGTRFAQSERTD